MSIVRITLACLTAGIVAGCQPEPKDAELIKNFRAHREEFEALRVMIVHDEGLHRVDDTWTNPTDPMSIGVTPERIAEYRAIFRRLGIPRGFYSYPSSIELLAHCEGLSMSGSSKGYAWLASPPTEIVPDLDEIRARRTEEARKQYEHEPNSYRKHWNVYRLIEGNWYLHYDS